MFTTETKAIKLCLEKYKNLPKTGKPTKNEWTVLAGIVQTQQPEWSRGSIKQKVVALATGTKCLGGSEVCKQGWTLHDSHAEVLVRRALKRYFYHEMMKQHAPASIFQWKEELNCFQLKEGYSFQFVCSHPPCGDGSILEEYDEESEENLNNDEKEVMQAEVLKLEAEEMEQDVAEQEDMDDIQQAPAAKRLKLETIEEQTNVDERPSVSDAVYTGAKLINTKDDEDAMQQTVGAMRLKPGRGDRTLSMSCSDKMAKWNILGIQGALLDALLDKPIYLESLCFFDTANVHAISRAILERFANKTMNAGRYHVGQPVIIVSFTELFQFAFDENKQPSPNGWIWSAVDEKSKPLEISVNGKHQGLTKEHLNSSKAALNISRYHLLRQHIELLMQKPQLLSKFNLNANELKGTPYRKFKMLAKDYQNTWQWAKSNYFMQWSEKPKDLQEFSLEDERMET